MPLESTKHALFIFFSIKRILFSLMCITCPKAGGKSFKSNSSLVSDNLRWSNDFPKLTIIFVRWKTHTLASSFNYNFFLFSAILFFYEFSAVDVSQHGKSMVLILPLGWYTWFWRNGWKAVSRINIYVWYNIF